MCNKEEKKEGKISAGKIIGVGLGLAAAAAAVLLATSPKLQKKVKKWAEDMKGEVVEKIKDMQDLTQEKYNQIIDEVKPKYEKLKDVSAEEINTFVEELKSHWTKIAKEVEKQTKKKK